MYVGDDDKLHFVDSAGADTVLPFKSGVSLRKGEIFVNNTISKINGNTITIARNTIYGVCMFIPSDGYSKITITATNMSKGITVWYDDGTTTSAISDNNITHSIDTTKTISLIIVASNYMKHNDNKEVVITLS